jgi:hypothetical protein
MATLTLRSVKGSPLTFTEMDDNLTGLNTKQELIDTYDTGASMDRTTDFIVYWDTGTSTTKKISPNDSVFFQRTIVMKCIPDDIPTYVGDGIARTVVPNALNLLNLFAINAHIFTVGSGLTKVTVQLHNETSGLDVLSTPVTIDVGESDSITAAVPPVINSAGTTNRVSEGDVLRIDVDAISTGAKGLEVRMTYKG